LSKALRTQMWLVENLLEDAFSGDEITDPGYGMDQKQGMGQFTYRLSSFATAVGHTTAAIFQQPFEHLWKDDPMRKELVCILYLSNTTLTQLGSVNVSVMQYGNEGVMDERLAQVFNFKEGEFLAEKNRKRSRNELSRVFMWMETLRHPIQRNYVLLHLRALKESRIGKAMFGLTFDFLGACVELRTGLFEIKSKQVAVNADLLKQRFPLYREYTERVVSNFCDGVDLEQVDRSITRQLLFAGLDAKGYGAEGASQMSSHLEKAVSQSSHFSDTLFDVFFNDAPDVQTPQSKRPRVASSSSSSGFQNYDQLLNHVDAILDHRDLAESEQERENLKQQALQKLQALQPLIIRYNSTLNRAMATSSSSSDPF